MFGSFLEMHGKTFDYKIKYTSIVRLFQLPRPDRASVVFVVSLEPPIRQGQAVYPHVVMQIEEKTEMTVRYNFS
jgi:structure-specific recognition protein 1